MLLPKELSDSLPELRAPMGEGHKYSFPEQSNSGGHPDGCRLNEFFEGPPPCIGVSVDQHARRLDECRWKMEVATKVPGLIRDIGS